jgi:hypothetical protein
MYLLLLVMHRVVSCFSCPILVHFFLTATLYSMASNEKKRTRLALTPPSSSRELAWNMRVYPDRDFKAAP